MLDHKEASKEHTKYTVRLDASAKVRGAVVRIDVVVFEEDQKGQRFEFRIPRKVRIRESGTVSQKFDYKLENGQVVSDYRLEQRRRTS